MLHDFITKHRDTIIARTRAKVAQRTAPRATAEELDNGVPLFLTQLVETLVAEPAHTPPEKVSGEPPSELTVSATAHGLGRLQHGFTIAQLVHDYGDICQTVMALAVELNAPITNQEFKTLNACLDESIAGAVTEFGRMRDRSASDESTERLGVFAHELRNLLGTALLSFESIKRGLVGVGGSTAAIHGRSLLRLRDLIDRSLAEVRLEAGAHRIETFPICDVLEEVEVHGGIVASAREVRLAVTSFSRDVMVHGDRQLVASAVSNLLLNAIKFTPPGGHVIVRTRVTGECVAVDVEDECGGLPPGKVADLFRPFEQRGKDRSGLGLGLHIAMKAAKANGGDIAVVNAPGKGCTFTVTLPRAPASS